MHSKSQIQDAWPVRWNGMSELPQQFYNYCLYVYLPYWILSFLWMVPFFSHSVSPGTYRAKIVIALPSAHFMGLFLFFNLKNDIVLRQYWKKHFEGRIYSYCLSFLESDRIKYRNKGFNVYYWLFQFEPKFQLLCIWTRSVVVLLY